MMALGEVMETTLSYTLLKKSEIQLIKLVICSTK